MSYLTSVVETPDVIFKNFSGTTWTGTIFGFELSDPLAVATNSMAQLFTSDNHSWRWVFIATALIPIFITILFGRIFCGWICPATFIYELNDNLGTWLQRIGFPTARREFDFRLKYIVLIAGVLLTIPLGATLVSSLYPPAVLGRELYFSIAMGGFGVGATIFVASLLFDLMVSRRGICRYVCPGGALYSILGRYRILRVSRDVSQCNDCGKCNTACQMGLDPMQDQFGQECNNCTACIAICPTDSLNLNVIIKDKRIQGPGHLGANFNKKLNRAS